MDRCGFITFEKQSNRPKGSIGSTRIRARWLYEQWDGAEEYQIGQEYDILVYQKVYWKKMMTQFDGIQILDLCDPDWLEGRDVMRYVHMADAVVTSTQPLADYIKKFVDDKDKPIICIPDRMKLDEHLPYAKDIDDHKEKIESAVWFGYLHNTKYLDAAIEHLIKRDIDLTVIAEKEYVPAQEYDVEYVKWSYPNYHKEVAKHDIALLPKAGEIDYRGQFKSNNKELTSMALGVPVVSHPDDFERLKTKEARVKEAKQGLKEVKEKWNAKLSVKEYKELIDELKATKG